jgi:predicted transcriptional regulator
MGYESDQAARGAPNDGVPQRIGVRKKRWVVCFDNAVLNLDLSVYEKMVYVVLCSHASKDGTSFPSVARIAEEASCGRSKVFAALKVLEERGLVSRSSRIIEGRGQTANLYEIIDIEPRPPRGRGDGLPPPPSTGGTPPSTERTGGVRDVDGPIEELELRIYP